MVQTTAAESRLHDSRLIQVSDCHISADPKAVYREADPRAGLRAVMNAVRAWRPDLILATGDLSEDASIESYRWLSETLRVPGIPVLTLPGNHDLPTRQQAFFPKCPGHEPLIQDLPRWRLILLNSIAEGEVQGRLSDEMLGGLKAALEGGPAHKVVLLHHQPVAVGSPWIDRYALSDPDRLWAVLDNRTDVRAVCWGHVHHALRLDRGDMSLMAAPATSVNSLPARQKFTPDPAGPACRWLKLGMDGGLESGVLRGRAPAEGG